MMEITLDVWLGNLLKLHKVPFLDEIKEKLTYQLTQ